MTTTTSAADHKDEFIRLRKAGFTYREIGARFGLSYERVRQVLAAEGGSAAWARVPAATRMAREIADITAWLEDNGPVERAAVMEKFGLTASRMTTLVAAGLPTHLIVMPGRSTEPEYSDEEVHDAMRSAWAELQRVNPASTGMSHVMYERVRRHSDPSAPMIVARYGWEEACVAAGVPHGASWRSKESYRSRWTDAELLVAVNRYFEHCRAAKLRPSYLGYERWQQEHADAPSGTLIRNRMRAAGLPTWPDILRAAIAAHAA